MAKIIQEDWVVKLTKVVQDAGQEIIDRASDIVGTGEMLSRMTITIDFDPAFQMLSPIIMVDKEYLCKRALERLTLAYVVEEKGENDD